MTPHKWMLKKLEMLHLSCNKSLMKKL